MLSDLEPNNFHDGILRRLIVDSEAEQIQLVLKQWNDTDDDNFTNSELTFDGVAWQYFKDLEHFNCLFDIQVVDNFQEFAEYEKEYLAKMKNYFPTGKLESIKADPTFKYYYLNSSHGLSGFIICKSLSIVETQQPVDTAK